jgi:hypothetical protein
VTSKRLAAAVAGAVVALGAAVVLTGLLEPAQADEKTIALAQAAYERAQAEGVDMSRGPCLGAGGADSRRPSRWIAFGYRTSPKMFWSRPPAFGQRSPETLPSPSTSRH